MLPAWYGGWPAPPPILSLTRERGTEKHPKGSPQLDQHLRKDPTL